MGRGPSQRTLWKKELIAARGTAIVLEQARARIELEEHSKPFNKKKLIASLTMHIGKFIDRMTVDDVVKIAGWIGATIITHTTLKASVDFAAQIAKITVDQANLISNWYNMIAAVFPVGPWAGTAVPKGTSEEVKKDIDEASEELDKWLWILSIVIGALVVLFGAEILSAAGGVVKFAGMLAGLG